VSDCLLYKPEVAAAKLTIGRSKLFELIAAGQIETVQIGRSRRIPAQALEAYVDRLRAQSTTAAELGAA
jgi:excisionase family DNA binding protein